MFSLVVLFGVSLNIFGTLIYVRDTLRGETKPNRISWALWTIAPLIGAAAAIAKDVEWMVVLPVLVTGVCPLLIFLASFVNPNAYWRLGKFDYMCGIFSILALVLWAITKEPAVAIIFAILSDGFAGVPTLAKAWKMPETETGVNYLMAVANALSAFAVMSVWSFAEYAFPAYLVIINASIAYAIYRLQLKRLIFRGN